jgi:large subunit ribosomal protein L22
MTTQDLQEAKAHGRYIRMSPSKVRRVLNQIRGRSYKDALLLLEFMPYRACGPVWQIVQSAAANAQNNLNLNKENLIIGEAFANEGPVMKRIRPRAQGQAYQIKKPTCHISITLKVKN